MLWVDVLVDRDQVHHAVRELAQSRIIELRPYDRGKPPFTVAHNTDLLEQLLKIQDRLDRFKPYLPQATHGAIEDIAQPSSEDVLADLQRCAENWLRRAQPILSRIDKVSTELERLQLLSQCIAAVGEENIDLDYFQNPPEDAHTRYLPIIGLGRIGDEDFFAHGKERSLFQKFVVQEDPKQIVFIGFADAEILPELEQAGHARGARFAVVPHLVSGPPPTATEQTKKLLASNKQELERLREDLDALDRELEFGKCLWQMRRQIWLQQVLKEGLIGNRFVWLGGWIVARRYGEMVELLEAPGISFLISRDDTNKHGEPPIHLLNPRWVRMFEIFARGFGMPARNEVDPSPLLAITTPVMFGYMFGDVGQGLVILLAGLLLRRRYEVMGLFVPAGIASMVFGFLFGSIFGYEHVLPALWLHPMVEPMPLLIVPVVFGFLFIVTGMALSGIQAHWAQSGKYWRHHELPVLIVYTSIVIAVWDLRLALAVAIAGSMIFLFFVAQAGFRKNGLVQGGGKVATALLELAETLIQLVINTISFARLGAFALAHAGLNSAVVTLSEIPDSKLMWFLILVLGNILVITLEGLVVSIQTTRLIMFEFFRRFYGGTGRSFRPLSLPEMRNGDSA